MRVVIVGSGIAGVTFAEKIRSLCQEALITLVTWETDGYYSRPLLSRGFSKDDIERTIILKSFDKLHENNITIISGAKITAINRDGQTVSIEGSGPEKLLRYDKLILAQGSAAFIPQPFKPYADMFYCLNSLVDLKTLRRFRQSILNRNQNPHWAIIGGGLIGCEVASDLSVAGDQVTLFHAMDRLMERQLVDEDSVFLQKVLENSGVNVLLNQHVQGFSKRDEKICVNTNVTAEFDSLIVSCGFLPRTELAKQAGLDIGRGIKVNQFLQTTDENIYALGDVAELPNGKLYAFILPIRSQSLWLATFLAGQEQNPWTAPIFTTKAKVHGFEAVHPYNL